MSKDLPSRPHLDHLRRQAKQLLRELGAGDPDAIATILQHLPEARGMTAAQVMTTPFRLADAQSAIARKTGFAGWPHLARHVEQLRAMEGSWSSARLEINGSAIPAAGLADSRILIDGDLFRSETPEAIYEGVFNINVEAQPHEIDIEFVEGPEAGRRNFGIFQLDRDRLEICLDINGNPRPRGFHTSPGSGHACESLTRTSAARPRDVSGGTRTTVEKQAATQKAAPDASPFAYANGATLQELQGEWTAVKIVRDGQPLPAMMLRAARRLSHQNEVMVSVAGQIMVHALVRLDESTEPIRIDYYMLDGSLPGTIQQGIMEWVGDEACFCMAAPGRDRPSDFLCAQGSGRTLSQWRREK